MLTGYWQFDLSPHQGSTPGERWYLALSQGHVIYSGEHRLSWGSLVQALERFVPKLRSTSAKTALRELEQNTSPTGAILLGNLLNSMERLELLRPGEGVQALHTRILTDLDTHLMDRAGQAEFIPDYQLVAMTPIRGFDLGDVLTEAAARRDQWKSLRREVPSLASIPIFHQEAVQRYHLSEKQQALLRTMAEHGKNLEVIAYDLGKDPLEVARAFANWIRMGIVSLQTVNPRTTAGGMVTGRITSPPQLAPEIFIVDDSPVLLSQLQDLLIRWGYRVSCTDQPLEAVQVMLERKPAAIFLDINMPGASGFELIKLIRRQPALTMIPIVLMTAEKSKANQWRAQWANCQFIAKPRTAEEIMSFQKEMRSFLLGIAPLPGDPSA
jgi:CheY-like chemotaxis protein